MQSFPFQEREVLKQNHLVLLLLLLVCWSVGLLVCLGLLFCWFVGLLVCWFVVCFNA